MSVYKAFIQKSSFLLLSALLLSACGQKFNDLPNTRVLKTCQSPIITYHLINVKSGDYNDLTTTKENVQQMVEKSLAQSGCFKPFSEEETEEHFYQLEVIYGNINSQNRQGGFWQSQTSDQAVFEVQLNFSKAEEMRIFRGKSSIQNQKSQFLIFGNKAKLNPNQIQITLQNAINSAINEAIRNFIQIQSTDSTNYSNF